MDMKDNAQPLGPGPMLPAEASIPSVFRDRVARDYDRFARDGHPENLEAFLLDEYGLDVRSEYAGQLIRNPWGKASGQLSMNLNQVHEDAEGGLGFIVLKTVIAQDSSGDQSMKAWAVPESRMVVEPIKATSGETGWTVTWKGRGWWQPFEDYLQLVRDSRRLALESGVPVIPSCKFHLPAPGEAGWRESEYQHTVAKLLNAWHAGASVDAVHPPSPMPIEKDCSPTLAGSDRAAARSAILSWIRESPRLIREAGRIWWQNRIQTPSEPQPCPVLVSIKLFNALFGDEFQVELLQAVHAAPANSRPDWLVWGNRLFDPDREFDGHRGVAYGGPDLSDRNLRTMNAFREQHCGEVIPWSATGNITSGKMAVEYLLQGATSFQLHTFFQLPASEYRMKQGSRTRRALHELYFHPRKGLVVWLEHLRRLRDLEGPVRLLDLSGRIN